MAVSGSEGVTDGLGRMYSVSDVETHWRLCGHRLTVEEGTKLAGVLARRHQGEWMVTGEEEEEQEGYGRRRAPAKKTSADEEGEVVRDEAKAAMYALKSGGHASAESVDSLVYFRKSAQRA